jgi:hypothetical protein
VKDEVCTYIHLHLVKYKSPNAKFPKILRKLCNHIRAEYQVAIFPPIIRYLKFFLKKLKIDIFYDRLANLFLLSEFYEVFECIRANS